MQKDIQKILGVVKKHKREIEARHKIKAFGIGYAERRGEARVRDENSNSNLCKT